MLDHGQKRVIQKVEVSLYSRSREKTPSGLELGRYGLLYKSTLFTTTTISNFLSRSRSITRATVVEVETHNGLIIMEERGTSNCKQ
jgi:hypothetical protein